MGSIYDAFLERYGSLTSIQQAAIPIISSGSNCVVVAPTGAGKTEAVMLPVIDSIMESGDAHGIKVVYITPLRALNRDMIKRLEWLCAKAGISVSVRHGDTSQSERRKQARAAPAVLITTPETLQSILPTKSFRGHLKNVRFVVVDEIHELYPSKRGAQLSVALERLAELAPNFTRICISATVADPDSMGRFLCNNGAFKVAKVNIDKKLQLGIEMPERYKGNAKEIADKFGLDEGAVARLHSIAKHISESRSTLIFANTRQVVEALGSRLVYMNKVDGFGGIGVHHSSLDKAERIDIENRFKEGTLRSMIATSSLELGIDIGSVDLVIQYGSPRQALRLAQRVGRSGHSEAGVSRGVVIAIDEMDALESAAVYRNLKEGRLESFGVHEKALDVLCQQVCGIALERDGCGVDEVLSTVRRSFVYRRLEPEELKQLLAFMSRQHMVGFDGERVTAGSKTRMYYYGHLSAIPDTKRVVVKSAADNRVISALDERFVATNLEEGTVFIVKGLPWKVISIDDDIVSVEPSEELEAAVPDWTGEDIPVSRAVAQGVMEAIGRPAGLEGLRCLSESDLAKVSEFSASQRKFGVTDRNGMLVERSDEYCVVHTALGTMANEALARLIAHLIAARFGRSVNVRASPYFVLVEVPGHIDVPAVLRGIKPGSVRGLMEDAIRDTELFRYRFITVAKFFGVVERDATVSKSIAKRIIRVMRDTPVYRETLRELMNNYFDVESVAGLVGALQEGTVKARTVANKEMSPLTRSILDAAYYTRELIMPVVPSRELVESFSRFLLKKEMKFVCTYCGFVFSRGISEIKDSSSVGCPSCGSPMVARYRDDFLKVVRKRAGGRRLAGSERAVVKEMMAEASLFDSYGGKAAVALSAYGVGPRSAARALFMNRNDERLFYTDLIEAQKQFIRTRKYWSLG